MLVPSVSTFQGAGGLQRYFLWLYCIYACAAEWHMLGLSPSSVNSRVLLWASTPLWQQWILDLSKPLSPPLCRENKLLLVHRLCLICEIPKKPKKQWESQAKQDSAGSKGGRLHNASVWSCPALFQPGQVAARCCSLSPPHLGAVLPWCPGVGCPMQSTSCCFCTCNSSNEIV